MTGEERFARYARLGPCIATYAAERHGQIRVYEMLPEELELKFVAVPADGTQPVLPFFTRDGMSDYARRSSWKDMVA